MARYWAEELSNQDGDAELKALFSTSAKELGDNEGKILQDLVDCQGKPMDIGGYYRVASLSIYVKKGSATFAFDWI